MRQISSSPALELIRQVKKKCTDFYLQDTGKCKVQCPEDFPVLENLLAFEKHKDPGLVTNCFII